MMPSLMEHYDEMEYRFDAHRIPHQDRRHYKIIEYEYLSLMIHDTTTDQYMVNLSPKDQEPTGRIYKFFSKQDNVTTARAKWFAAVRPEYELFWETLLSDIHVQDISLDTAVIMFDMVMIVRFLNPQAIAMVHNHTNYRNKLNELIMIGMTNANWATTRHQFYYKWIYFGWRKLDPSYPLHKSCNKESSGNITN